MTKSFKEFIEAYDNGTITDDAAWRAYDIEGMCGNALSDDTISTKAMGILRVREIGHFNRCARVAADYDIASPARANMLLAYWWLWASIALGERTHKLTLRSTE